MQEEHLPVAGPVFLIEVEKIEPNPEQPRRNFDEDGLRELANSIREFGILQPIIVTKVERETEVGTEVKYVLIAGERRWLAAKRVGLERVPAIIRSVDLDRERLELAIIENIQRVNLNPIEAARAYARLQDQFKLTQREIASRLGKSREVIANTVRLLSLPQEIQGAVSDGRLSESQARLLMMVEDIPQQRSLFEDILRNNLSVREVKTRVRALQQGAPDSDTQGKELATDPEVLSVERELEEALGTKVKVERSGATGKITINFYSPEEFHGILLKLKPQQNQPNRPPEQPPSSQ